MSKKNNRAGQVHGIFLVVGYGGTRNGATLWECLCTKCGAVSLRQNRYFRKDRAVPQGCVHCKGKHHNLFKGYEEIPGVYLSRIEKQALDRRYLFSVTPKDLWELFLKQERKCYLTGLPLSFKDSSASLDRVDNTKGYEKGNVAWCHKEVNKMKGTLTLREFIYYANKVVKEPNVTELIE